MKFKGGALSLLCSSVLFSIAFGIATGARAQQTLGSINGVVTDTSGAVAPKTSVMVVGDQTKLQRSAATDDSGTYNFVNLPIGTYTLTFTHDGFQTLNIPSILVQANRTVTVDATLQVGTVGQTVTVNETPLINSVDTTNGYVLDTSQLSAVPLPTGSFTGVAILTPGVNAELSGGSGANAGLGNSPIWANGQRDTSNSFLLNGVDGSNLFNGKSTSQVASARIVNNTGVSGASNLSSDPVQSTASPYLAIGESLPSPPPETLAEVRVNASMYDAQQGSSSGAHIDMSTSSGTNEIHGSAYFHGETNMLNAAPFFFNADPNLATDQKVPGLNRFVEGGTLGGPIKKNKLFYFISYQNLHDADQEIGISRTTVPPGLTNDRSAQTLANLANSEFPDGFVGSVDTVSGSVCQSTACEANTLNTGDINPIAYALLNYKLPNGQYLIPSANGSTPSTAFPEDALVPGTAYFIAHQGVADLDWDPSPTHTVAAKYYYQDDPSIAPYAYSSFAGFTQHLTAGSQVFSLNNSEMIGSNLSVTEIFGFDREKLYSSESQPFTPNGLATYVEQLTGATPAASTINTFGSSFFPGMSIVDTLGETSTLPYTQAMTFGAGSASQGDLTGVFQNRFEPSADAIWIHNKHTITFGGNFSYTQLNTRDNRTQLGMIAFPTFSDFLQGIVTPIPGYNFNTTSFLVGDASRYYRANQMGEYIEDKFQIRSNLSLTFGLRVDWDGGLTEKYGHIYNFNPGDYSFNENTDAFNTDSNGNPETGIVVAGNNAQFPTPGESKTTLTGRQYGFAPRFGAAWSPKKFDNKLVIRAGSGIYCDRGELFTYLSPGYTAGETTGGPFGVNQAPPAVATQVCPAETATFYFPAICDPSQGYSFANPWGPTKEAAPSGNPATIVNSLPNMAAIEDGAQPLSLASYAPTNKLPYSIASTFDVQWQPRSDIAIDIGYVNALGRHEVVPIPFNQPGIATPTAPIHGQDYTYGYTVLTDCSSSAGCSPITLPNGQGQELETFEGGNTDLRVPYIGYAGESEMYTAAGVSVYNALQMHFEKRMSHGLQAGVSYTLSRSMDDQSAMGLFYNGNNPLNLHSAYGLSDFDRTHVINFDFRYELHSFAPEASLMGVFIDGWSLDGIVTIQSGQPYSVVDYTGAVGSIFYGVANGITNPVVPLVGNCTAQSAVTGTNGTNPNDPALNVSCFGVQTLAPGALNGAIPPGDEYETNFVQTSERNIFRQPWQRVANISVVKMTKIGERLDLRVSLDVYNITNTPSFDLPIDNVFQNEFYNGFPIEGQPALPNTCTGSGPTNGSFYNCPG
ncbi:MAG: carboxypeptidase-like regulatory domain-containing protein, partial [Candidatus Acidiferrales bacterium]